MHVSPTSLKSFSNPVLIMQHIIKPLIKCLAPLKSPAKCPLTSKVKTVYFLAIFFQANGLVGNVSKENKTIQWLIGN